jgi:Uma2 family endonuclease
MTNMAMLESGRWGGKALPGQNELPCDDGEPMETSFHQAQPAVLIDTLIGAWAERTDYYVAGNMFVYFSEHQLRNNDFRGPDVFVVLDTVRKPRKSWVAWEEGGKLPDVVIEVTSESTREVDRNEKKRVYARIWRTPAYFIFEPETEKLEGYRLDAGWFDYVAMPRDGRGDFWLPRLGLGLGLRRTRYRDFDQPFVRWIDSTGEALPTADERAEQERARAEQERARAEQAERQLHELRARLGAEDDSGEN